MEYKRTEVLRRSVQSSAFTSSSSSSAATVSSSTPLTYTYYHINNHINGFTIISTLYAPTPERL